jgi:hypothetical protein
MCGIWIAAALACETLDHVGEVRTRSFATRFASPWRLVHGTEQFKDAVTPEPGSDTAEVLAMTSLWQLLPKRDIQQICASL